MKRFNDRLPFKIILLLIGLAMSGGTFARPAQSFKKYVASGKNSNYADQFAKTFGHNRNDIITVSNERSDQLIVSYNRGGSLEFKFGEKGELLFDNSKSPVAFELFKTDAKGAKIHTGYTAFGIKEKNKDNIEVEFNLSRFVNRTQGNFEKFDVDVTSLGKQTIPVTEGKLVSAEIQETNGSLRLMVIVDPGDNKKLIGCEHEITMGQSGEMEDLASNFAKIKNKMFKINPKSIEGSKVYISRKKFGLDQPKLSTGSTSKGSALID